MRSFTQLVTYDVFHRADIFLIQPLQIIVGSIADSEWVNEDLYNCAVCSIDKNFIS
ncbi:hypothetical protein AALK94_15740 [Bacteroides faecichinchillae]|uniref:hypothetical protein n=1 Tax=Bacteroides faecichinchillae TaxID=871325 RepID=UPI0035152C79